MALDIDSAKQKSNTTESDEFLSPFQAMFSRHAAIMLVIEPGTGKIVDVNAAACNFYGYSRNEILNMHVQDISAVPKGEMADLLLQALREKENHFVLPRRLPNGEIRQVDVNLYPFTNGGKTLLFSINFDVTDREQYREALCQEQELLRTTLFYVEDGVVITDPEGKIITLNKKAEQLTGWNEGEAKGLPCTQVLTMVSELTGKKTEHPMAKTLRSRQSDKVVGRMILFNKEGRQIPVTCTAAPSKDSKGQIRGVVLVFREVSREKSNFRSIFYMNYHDLLTGLYNRRFVEEEIRRLKSPRELPLTVIMGDLDGLKLTNDVLGHEAGDRLLKKAAKAIRESCRQEDIIARWGGDEFLILLPRTTARTAEEIIERIKNKCLKESGRKLQLSMALGYAVKTMASQSLRRVIKEAEEWMYRAKLVGENSYRKAIINTLLATLVEKSMETEQHAERLQRHCLAIGKQLALSIKDLEELVLLAKLHDIGKVAISEVILKKPGPLSVEEREEIKNHSAIGYRIAKNTPELSAVAEYILAHHERWDGQGYPRGLKGEEIPLQCRILAVADAYDAMTNDRSYRKAMSREEAIAEIRKNAGTQFDPIIANIFLRILAFDDNAQQNIGEKLST